MTGSIAMIRSMTAFAACERAATAGQLSCELRSVNHRFLELSLRLPEELRPAESALRERVAQKIARGKVDLSLRLRVGVGLRPQLQVNNELMEQLALLARRHHAQFPNMTIDFIELMRYPGVVEDAGIDQLGLQADALALLDRRWLEFVARASARAPTSPPPCTSAWTASSASPRRCRVAAGDPRRAARAPGPAPGRPQAAARSRPARAGSGAQPAEDRRRRGTRPPRQPCRGGAPRAVAARGGRPPARLPDAGFNREANTLGSKSVDARTTQAAVELKVLIEQLREQVQNLE
jgi:hypothetical protein